MFTTQYLDEGKGVGLWWQRLSKLAAPGAAAQILPSSKEEDVQGWLLHRQAGSAFCSCFSAVAQPPPHIGDHHEGGFK